MKKLNQIVYKVLFILAVFPVIFQDLPTGSIFGTIARCPVVFIIPFIFIALLLLEGRFILSSIPKYYLIYFSISVLSSIVMMLLVVLFFNQGSWYSYNEFFPTKLFKASQYTFVFFLFSYSSFLLIDKLNLKFILNVFHFLFFFLIFYGFAEFWNPYPVRFIHDTFADEWKTRLVLTGPEPSTTMLLFYCVAFAVISLRVYLNKGSLLTIIVLVLSLFMLLAIGSKSGVLFIILSLLWALRKNFSFKFLLVVIMTSIPIGYYFVVYVIPDLLSDIDNFTSFSTRTTTVLVAIKSLFVYPLGEGYGTYIHLYPQMLLPMNKVLSNTLSLPLLTYELEYMVDTGKFLGVKSGILQEIVYSGFIAAIFYYKLFKHYFKYTLFLNTKLLEILFVMGGFYCLIELLLTTEMLTAYYFLFPFLILYKICKIQSIDNN